MHRTDFHSKKGVANIDKKFKRGVLLRSKIGNNRSNYARFVTNSGTFEPNSC